MEDVIVLITYFKLSNFLLYRDGSPASISIQLDLCEMILLLFLALYCKLDLVFLKWFSKVINYRCIIYFGSNNRFINLIKLFHQLPSYYVFWDLIIFNLHFAVIGKLLMFANMFIPCKFIVKVYSKDFSARNKFKCIISKVWYRYMFHDVLIKNMHSVLVVENLKPIFKNQLYTTY